MRRSSRRRELEASGHVTGAGRRAAVRQFLLRGVEKVASEWGLVCLAHNVLKLAQGRTPSLAALATG